jgi:hypothetical protein
MLFRGALFILPASFTREIPLILIGFGVVFRSGQLERALHHCVHWLSRSVPQQSPVLLWFNKGVITHSSLLQLLQSSAIVFVHWQNFTIHKVLAGSNSVVDCTSCLIGPGSVEAPSSTPFNSSTYENHHYCNIQIEVNTQGSLKTSHHGLPGILKAQVHLTS